MSELLAEGGGVMDEKERFKPMEESVWYKWATGFDYKQQAMTARQIYERHKERQDMRTLNRRLNARSDDEGCGAVIAAALFWGLA